MSKKGGAEKTEYRPPVVTFMGHVDHGKTSILDRLRSTDIASHEAGGITQQIGASQVEVSGRKITFLDTPGHEAFTKMRLRGGKVADIVVLVVAADEGVKEQTREAISHAKAAKVPIVVAINKVDLRTANIEKVKEQLAEENILVEDWGGDVVCVPVSAKTGEGIKEFLEMILLVADLAELRSEPFRALEATVIESFLDDKRGPMATVIVNTGILKAGDAVGVGDTRGKVKALINDKGRKVREARPGDPVEILGLKEVPEVGAILHLLPAIKEPFKKESAAFKEPVEAKESDTGVLNLILKADRRGSLEAIQNLLSSLKAGETKLRYLHFGVGNISGADVLLASTAEAVILGFRVKASREVWQAAKASGVKIQLFATVYELEEAVKGVLEESAAKKKYEGKGLGEIKKVFVLPSKDRVAGSRILEGIFREGERIRLLRDDQEVYQGTIKQIRMKKERVKRVTVGQECGVLIKPEFDFREGDMVEII